jgi:hypothetical protein
MKLSARAAVDGSREDLEHLTSAGINKSSPTIRPDTVLSLMVARTAIKVGDGDVKPHISMRNLTTITTTS